MAKFVRGLHVVTVVIILMSGVNVSGQQNRDTEFQEQVTEAKQLLDAGRYDEALSLAKEATSLAEQTWGREDARTATALLLLGYVYAGNPRPDYAHAVPALTRALSILERTLGRRNGMVLASTLYLAEVYVASQQDSRAAELISKVLPILNDLESDADTQFVLPAVVQAAQQYTFVAKLRRPSDEAEKDAYAHAEALYASCLKIAERMKNHNQVSFQCLTGRARMRLEKGETSQAGDDFAQALSFLPDDIKEQNQEVADLVTSGHYREALPLAEEIVARLDKTGQGDSQKATALNNLAYLYDINGDLKRTESLYVQALSIYDNISSDDASRVQVRFNLADHYITTREYSRADQLLSDALAICDKAYSSGQMRIVPCLQKVGQFYMLTGDYERAEPLFVRASKELGQTVGYSADDRYKGKLERANLLSSLAIVYALRGDTTKAEGMLRESFTITENALEKDSPTLGGILISEALWYKSKGDYQKAEKLSTRAIGLYERILGRDSPQTAVALINLADLLAFSKGDFNRAQKLYAEALHLLEALLGPDSPYVKVVLDDLSALEWQQGDLKETLKYIGRSVSIDQQKSLFSLSGSEMQKQSQLHSNISAIAISFYLQAARADSSAARLAATAVLVNKARLLETSMDDLAIFRRHLGNEDRKLLDEMVQLSSRISGMTLNGPGKRDLTEYQAELEQLRRRMAQLQSLISLRNSDFRIRSQPVTLSAVQESLPEKSALVEFFSYSRYNPTAFPKQWQPERYAVFVLLNHGDPVWIDIGELKEIDMLSRQFRFALTNPENETQTKEIARELDEQVMRPVRKLLQGRTEIFVSPDGQLNLLPFEALRDETGHYLVEHFQFTYLSTGRDLMRLPNSPSSRQSVVILANPAYGSNHGANVQSEPTKHWNRTEPPFEPLPGTVQEIELLQDQFPSAETLEGEQASKERLQKVAGPRVLHIATHGFFLEDLQVPGPLPLGEDRNGPCIRSTRPQFLGKVQISNLIDSIPGACDIVPNIALPAENANPMVRSGLALAGALSGHPKPASCGHRKTGHLE